MSASAGSRARARRRCACAPRRRRGPRPRNRAARNRCTRRCRSAAAAGANGCRLSMPSVVTTTISPGSMSRTKRRADDVERAGFRGEDQPPWITVDEYMRAGERLWAIGDVTGIWPLTHVGEYQGEVVAANIARRAACGQLRRRSARHLHRSASGGRRRRSRRVQRDRALSEVAEDRHLLRTPTPSPTVPDAAERRRATDRRLRARA